MAVIYLGSINGGWTRQTEPLLLAIRQMASWSEEMSEPDDSLSLDIVFHVPGPMFKPEFQGIRAGSLFRKDRTLQVQVAAPDAFESESVMKEWLADALSACVAEARSESRRRKIQWSVEPAASVAQSLVVRLETQDRA